MNSPLIPQHSTERDRKIDQFFRFIKTIYGKAKFEAQWPTELDLQAALHMWGDKIAKHTPEELRIALDHAQRMMIQGEDEWQWPNIGLMLSGAKLPTKPKPLNRPDPSKVLPPEEQRRRAQELLAMLMGERA